VVYSGDYNIKVHDILAELRAANVEWAPTFAFVDPDGPNCHWSTLEALARHKPSTSKSKVEMWILFPTMFMRQLPLRAAGPRPEHKHQIDLMFGNDQWELIYKARRRGELEGGEARDEYVNLMRWRIEQSLGYDATHAIDIPNEQGRPIYTMIFATDHEAGDRIMASVYRKIAAEFPLMRIQAAEIAARKRGDRVQTNLFAEDPAANAEHLPVGNYYWEAPRDPPGTAYGPDGEYL